jgi:uncharacterized protein YjdB
MSAPRGVNARCSAAHCLAISALVLLSSACRNDGLDPGTAVDTVVVVPANATISVGSTVVLQAEARDADGNPLNREAFWSAADSDIASVAIDGRVTAHRVGQVQIAASVEGKSGLSSINVTRTPVSSVRLLPANASLSVGGTVQLSVEARDASGGLLTGRVAAWTSSNPAVATVTATGLVTALSAGASIISADCEGKTGLASVNVSGTSPSPTQPPPGQSTITVTPATATISLGKTVQLTAVFTDGNGQVVSKDFKWSTSNSHIATVSSKGKVTGRGPGRATITASASGVSGTSSIAVR